MNFMKTLEEIKEHLSEVGYTTNAMLQIEGFLIGGEHIAPNEEITFKRGEKDFEYFMEWFLDNKTIDEEYEKGDYIHVEDEVDVLCLSDVEDGKFVGTSGKIIHQYGLTKDSRFCNEEEIRKVDERLKAHGIAYCHVGEELYPIIDEEENEIPSECLDCMETQCHEAIENIVANLHAKEIGGLEKTMVVDSLKILIELGKMYE